MVSHYFLLFLACKREQRVPDKQAPTWCRSSCSVTFCASSIQCHKLTRMKTRTDTHVIGAHRTILRKLCAARGTLDMLSANQEPECSTDPRLLFRHRLFLKRAVWPKLHSLFSRPRTLLQKLNTGLPENASHLTCLPLLVVGRTGPPEK